MIKNPIPNPQSLIPSALIRLACNRDEARTRPEALPPEVQQFGDRRAILPIDPVGGGTWIAVNDSGLAFTLLNAKPAVVECGLPTTSSQSIVVGEPQITDSAQPAIGNPKSEIPQPLTSRGLIIPSLLDCSRFDTALVRALDIDTTQFAPFRLVILDERELAELVWNGRDLHLLQRVQMDQPRMFTSSGLGDQIVSGPRRELFAEMFGEGATDKSSKPSTDANPDLLSVQDAFHAHRWPDRPHLSVSMSRPDARTVSFSTVEIRPDSVALSYASNPDQPRPEQSPAHALTIPRAAVASST